MRLQGGGEITLSLDAIMQIKKLHKAISPAIVSLIISSCHPAETTTKIQNSPGGYYQAKLEITDRGSCCRPSAEVTLLDVKDRIGENKMSVFKGSGGWPIDILWIGPQSLLIIFCDGDRYEVKSGIFEEKETIQSGRRSRLTVQVITSAETSIAGRAICHVKTE